MRQLYKTFFIILFSYLLCYPFDTVEGNDSIIKTSHSENNLLRLRGVMIKPDSFTAEDLKVIAGEWKANHLRWQFLWDGFPNSPADDATIDEYNVWIDRQCEQLDKMLPELERNGVRIALDLHTPPGGRYNQDKGFAMRLFNVKQFQDAFIVTWKKLAHKYKDSKAVWGYDILNEPAEDMLEEGLMNWRELALKTAKEIRMIDTVKAVIVQPSSWANPNALEWFEPFDPKEISNVIYSVHIYLPHSFTHQGVYDDESMWVYPGIMSDGKFWDKSQIRNSLQVVSDFANNNNVAIYIGEFGSIRWAPENSTYRYLKNCIEIFEEKGWDWAYHAFREWNGWSVEHSTDKNDNNRVAEPTDRELLLRSWFEKNER